MGLFFNLFFVVCLQKKRRQRQQFLQQQQLVEVVRRRRSGIPERSRKRPIMLSILMKLLMKLLSDVPNSRLITVATISDKLRVNGSLARAAIRDLESKGLIKKVSTHNAQLLYTHVEKQKEPETTAA